MLYSFGGDTGISYEQLQQRRKMVDRLRLQNSQTPKNVGEGIQAIARALVARGVDRQNVEADKKMQDSLNSAFEDILGGSFDSYSSSAYGPYTPAAEKSLGLDMGTEGELPQNDGVTVGGKTYDMGKPVGSDYASAIASVESSGRYDAIGPVTKNGNRAYGKYQVMDFNIGPWTEEILGRRLTPQQFLADEDAQDAVFNAKFGSYVQKYGNPQDAASVWFSGRPMARAGNASDGYTTVPEYVAKFNRALGQPAGQNRQPVRTAQTGSFDPSIAKIAALVSHPALPEGQKMVLGALLKQRLAQSQPMTPLEQQQYMLNQIEIENARNPKIKGTEFNGNFINPYTGEIIAEGQQDMPTSVEEYNFYSQQEMGAGREPLSYADWSVLDEKAGNPALQQAQQDAKDTASDVVVKAATRALAAADSRAVGGWLGSMAAYNPSSNNAELYRQVDALKSIASAESLNAMRRQSATGGALGNVTEKELKLLSEQAGALDPKSPNFQRDLQDYVRTMLRTIHGMEAGDAVFQKSLAEAFGGKDTGENTSDIPTSFIEGVGDAGDISAEDVWNNLTPEERKLWQN